MQLGDEAAAPGGRGQLVGALREDQQDGGLAQAAGQEAQQSRVEASAQCRSSRTSTSGSSTAELLEQPQDRAEDAALVALVGRVVPARPPGSGS